jgi:hypothetical protein
MATMAPSPAGMTGRQTGASLSRPSESGISRSTSSSAASTVARAPARASSPRSVPATGRNLNSYNKNGLFSRDTALAGLVNDVRLTPSCRHRIPPGRRRPIRQDRPGQDRPHPRLTGAHPPPVLRKKFTVTCAMRHPVAPAKKQVRHGANEVRSWLS